MWFSVSVYRPVPAHFVAVFDVITARKRAEEALREQDRLLQDMSGMARIGGWGFDVATGQGKWTAEVARIHELDPGIEPTAELGLSFFHGESRQKIEAALEAAITLGQPYDLELELVTAKGTHKWVRTMGFPVKEGDRVLQVRGAIQDITERKQAEDEVRRLNAELEQRVRQRTAQLEAANQELEAFSYSVSHDLRAPLRAINGFAGILVEDYAEQLDAEGRRLLDVVRHEAVRMGKLIDDLLAFSRASRGQMRAAEVDMARLAQTVFEECAARVPERLVQFKLAGATPTVLGDLNLLRQVLANLLGNAVKYTKPRAEALVEFGGRREEGHTLYWVKDNGVGFDPKYEEKLFGIFQRLHTEEEFEGTGVGLALAQRIVHRHGGRIWAKGKPDEGAVFYFTLPNQKERS
jgi:signal transduction histidine kinase